MNLQTLSIILIIIILPVTLILTAYTKIQIDTIALQTMYTTKLKDATYDAIVAFQINTENNAYSTVSDSMRRDVAAVIQTFMTNLATNLGVSGADEISIKPYIPAMVFTLYDGYYIYSPAISRTQDGDENTEKTSYEHVLKPYIYYTTRYVNDTLGIDVVVNYSLDNYIVVTGYIAPGKYETNAGYLINPDNVKEIEGLIDKNEVLERRLPVTTITFTDNENKSFVRDVVKFDTNLADMIVTNQYGMETDRLSNGQYLRDTNIFKNPEQLSINRGIAGTRAEINQIVITEELMRAEIELAKSENSDEAKGNILKKWYDPSYLSAGGILEEKFKMKSDPYSIGYYVEPATTSYYIAPDSALQYYKEATEFTNWVMKETNLSQLKASDARKADGSSYEQFTDEYIFQFSNSNDPADEGSAFNEHRRNVVKASIQDNLSQAIASYNANSEGLGTVVNFQMPILSEEEWDQVLGNVGLITFMQGIQVGTKIFNDYAIVTSTTNKEYVSPDSIYYINPEKHNTDEVCYYHKIDCPYLDDTMKIVGYRNSDFDRKSYEVENLVSGVEYDQRDKDRITKLICDKDKKYYYYMHPEYACYYCIVNSSDAEPVNWTKVTSRLSAYYTAMAREKLNFYKTNSYFEIK